MRTSNPVKTRWVNLNLPSVFICAQDYYRGTVVKEEEWKDFLEAMRTPLPVAFRLSSITGFHEKLLERLQGNCFGLANANNEVDVEGEKVTVQPPQALSWYTPR